MDVERLKKALIRDEGLKLKPYNCPAGKLTIGVGRNIEDNGITEEEALFLLGNDVKSAAREIEARFPFFAGIDAARQEVLINMVFNLGISRFTGFKNMLAAVERGDHEAAAGEMLNSKWARQVGPRAARLAAQMRTGEAG